jgi:rRNA-processing protein FCF1
MKYLFLDTNVYLHYKDFEQIDWKTSVCDGEDFTIVVPPIVIREIEKQKDSCRGKIQARAKNVSSKFGGYFLENKVSEKIKIATCEDPSDKDFDGLKFNRSTNDDVLILSVIKSGYNKNDIIVISRDIPLLIKAQSNQLKYYKMADEFLIKEELSEEEKELIATKKELEKYKNRQPKPSVTFIGGAILLKFTKPKNIDLEAELEKFMDNLKSENPYYQKKVQSDKSYNSIFILNDPSDERIIRYNKELDEYYSEYEVYQRFKIKNNILSERFQEIRFEIHNDGTAQTGDMKIFIDFPENIKLYNKRSKVRMDNIEPVKPNLMGFDREFLISLALDQYNKPLTGHGIPQMHCWDEGSILTDNYFRYSDSRINHKLFHVLNIENSLFVDSAKCGNFNISWTISDSESIDLIRGDLNVLVKENL